MTPTNSMSSSVIAVFPGQGSQQVGMGKDLYETFAIAREVFEEASDAIHVDLKKLCFSGSEADLTLTENTQPCLLVTSVAAFRVAENELGFFPGVVAGHSLGEYSALVAIRSLRLEAATRWVRARGLAMQKAVPNGEGGMAALLGMEDEKIEALCKSAKEAALKKRQTETSSLTVPVVIEPANFNAPGQTVIAGSTDAIQEAVSLIKAGGEFSGGKIIPLQVSAPFHCSLMAAAKDRMAQLFSDAAEADQPLVPACAYVPNRTARMSKEQGLIFELLVEQVDHPVLWKQSIQSLLESGFTSAVEFGPGKVLSGLIKRIANQAQKPCKLTSVNAPSSIKELEEFLKG